MPKRKGPYSLLMPMGRNVRQRYCGRREYPRYHQLVFPKMPSLRQFRLLFRRLPLRCPHRR
jgi:hypothetical protein